MATNIAIDPASGRPYIQEGANDATLVEDPDGRGAYLLRGSVDAAVDHNDVHRSVDGGASWELVASGLPLNGTITDPECLVGAPTLYRVTAVSAFPSSSATVEKLNVSKGLSMYLNGGPGFDIVARLIHRPECTVTSGLANQEIVYFSGRAKPVALEGEATALVINATASLLPDRITPTGGGRTHLAQILQTLAQTPGRILYRDPTGRRVYGRITSMQVGETIEGAGTAQFTVTETEEV